MILQAMRDWYKANGYTLLDQAQPPVGAKFDAARIVIDRGLGGVMLSTRRIAVLGERRSECEYFDLLNQVSMHGDSAIEAWKSSTNLQGNF